jgi:hypothetical protein
MEVKRDFKNGKGAVPKTYQHSSANSAEMIVANEAVDKLITEGGEGFYNYVNSLGLSKDLNLIVLSSRHHYYYDSEEMNNAKTIVNLKELNQVKEIRSLLYSHLHFLPEKCNFIGRFVNNRKVERYTLRRIVSSKENIRNSDDVDLGIVSRFPFINMLYSLMDSKTNTYLSEKSVSLMLGVHGFKVINMKEVNGVTYFHSKKVREKLN